MALWIVLIPNGMADLSLSGISLGKGEGASYTRKSELEGGKCLTEQPRTVGKDT